MAHWITLYEVFYILIFILASGFLVWVCFVLFLLHQLCITVRKEHLDFKKCWKGYTTQSMNGLLKLLVSKLWIFYERKWTVTIHNSHRCEFRNASETPGMPDNLFFKFHYQVAPNPFTCSPCQSVLSKGCLVVSKRWGFFFCLFTVLGEGHRISCQLIVLVWDRN